MTLANAALSDQDGQLVEVICPTGKAEYFFGKDWTGRIALIRSNNLASRRNGPEAAARTTALPLPLAGAGGGGVGGGCPSILAAPEPAEIFPPPATLFERGDPRVKPEGRLSPASGRG